jgi:hypothetical protein
VENEYDEDYERDGCPMLKGDHVKKILENCESLFDFLAKKNHGVSDIVK